MNTIKTTVTTLLLLANAAICIGQEDSITIPFIAYWELGDTYTYEVTKIKQKWEQGELTSNDSTTYVATFEVVDSTEKTYKIKWSFKTALSKIEVPPALMEKFAKFQKTEIIYLTNEVGQYLGIENWEELGKMNTEMMTYLLMLLPSDKSDKNETQNLLESLAPLYNSKASVEQLVYKELQYLHYPFGAAFVPNQVIEYDEELPSVIGNGTIKAHSILKVEAVDVETSRCVLHQKMTLDPEDTQKTILSVLRNFGIKETELLSEMERAKFEINDDNRFEYFYYPGLPIKIETSRVSIIEMGNEKGKRIDKVIIELVK
jgi:hypothetical protein